MPMDILKTSALKSLRLTGQLNTFIEIQKILLLQAFYLNVLPIIIFLYRKNIGKDTTHFSLREYMISKTEMMGDTGSITSMINLQMSAVAIIFSTIMMLLNGDLNLLAG